MFFFFQAEDGIRDADVTGVQTCALPISTRSSDGKGKSAAKPKLPDKDTSRELRSEERRVGKSVDLGGRRIIKKKKEEELREWKARRMHVGRREGGTGIDQRR